MGPLRRGQSDGHFRGSRSGDRRQRHRGRDVPGGEPAQDTMLFLTVAAASSFLPARQMTASDPLVALRQV